MADYNSDRTGSNIDAVLDKADNLTQAAVGVGGNVGIGTASPNGLLELSAKNNASENNTLRITDQDTFVDVGDTLGKIEFYATDGAGVKSFIKSEYATAQGLSDLVLGVTSEAMRIDYNGNVGIGTASPSEKLESVTTDNTQSALSLYEETIGGESKLDFKVRNNAGNPIVMARISSQMASGAVGSESAHLKLQTTSAGTNQERARIDSSGNLLVGKTSSNIATSGVELTPNDRASFTRSSGAVILANRLSTDGEIVNFRKDGTTVGSIGVNGGRLALYDDTYGGISFWGGSNATIPCANGGGTTNGVMDLGLSGSRFKDLYLSGGVITSSDYRLKEDVQPMQSYADTIKQMNLVNFAWKDSGKREDGFIAHELQALVPSAVRGDKDAIDEDGNEQYQGVDPLKLIPVLTKALQEALERIEILESK